MSTSLLPKEIRRTARTSSFWDASYRWWLSRTWADESQLPDDTGAMVYVMLNPSIADDRKDDATVRKCMGFAAARNCTGIAIANLFCLVSTDPQALTSHRNPIGNHADHFLLNAVHLAQKHDGVELVVAWGSQPRLKDTIQARADLLWGMCVSLDVTPMCFGVTKDGSPRHPGRIGYDTPLVPWRPPAR